MKAAIFDQYLDTVGGGERYALTLAEFLLKENWQVDLFWDFPEIKSKLIGRLGLDIEKINFQPNIFKKSFLSRFKALKDYDLLFYISDGSVPFLFGKKNILHFQVPFQDVDGKSLKNQIKLKNIHYVVCNSNFTKSFIDKEFGVDSVVIYPPVAVEEFIDGKKENIILSVGRFSQLLQAKRQDILIKTFCELVDGGLKGWKLCLAGGTDIGAEDYLKKLKEMSFNYPVEIKENLPFKELCELYQKAKIFWSASGYGIDENKEPEKVEHFGIAPVEAMAAGAIPLLIKKGGFKEIIKHGKSGFFWEREDELKEKTIWLIKNQNLIKFQKEAIIRSKIFSKEKFYERIKDFIF